MRRWWAAFATVLALAAAASAKGKDEPKAAKEMERAIVAINQALALESYPPPNCVKREYGHMQIKADEAKACADKALKKEEFPQLGTDYVLAILMADVGPMTVIAVALDQPGWAALSCDPGRPCPVRHAGTDKMGKRVVERTDLACKDARTIWLPAKKGCP
jgi:hypothetical protein